ncbi:unnamed protein product [Ilex paraguariensis]|uniref:Transcription repressor n=1 Tax=Ilex paraguariensis TaxID=185542 RepID=A0ABC8RHN5_9AQUA
MFCISSLKPQRDTQQHKGKSDLMGNYRFRLSDMIPNAWFYKLKDMSRTRKQNSIHPTKKKHQPISSSSSAKQPHVSQQRKSYYFTRDLTPQPSHITFYNNLASSPKVSDAHFPDPPRKSSKKRRSTKRNRSSNRSSPRLVTSSMSAGCSCRTSLESVSTKPDSTAEEYPNSPPDSSSEHESLLPEIGSDRCFTPSTFDGMVSWSTSCHCGDIVIDMDNKRISGKLNELDKLDGFDTVSQLDLPPIITKPALVKEMKKKETNEPIKFRRSSATFDEGNVHGSLSVKVVKEDIINTASKEQRKSFSSRKNTVNSPGMKLRINSPRIASRRIQGRKSVSSNSSSSSRRSLSESLAVVKSSQNPQKDFRESMVEMIVENNIRDSKDLEELLACYLSLNADEYHELIIKVFKQIWFDITDVGLE